MNKTNWKENLCEYFGWDIKSEQITEIKLLLAQVIDDIPDYPTGSEGDPESDLLAIKDIKANLRKEWL